MAHLKFRWWGVWPLLFVAASPLSAQPESNPQFVSTPGCGTGVNFEKQQYQIGVVKVQDPFDFLYWVRGKVGVTESLLAPMLNGKPFTYQAAVNDAISLIEKQRMLPDNAVGFRASVILVAATNCHQNPNTLDLKYQIYSTVPAKILTATPESQQQAMKSPQDTAGLTQAGSAFHFTPAGGFDGAYRWFGGGRLEVTRSIAKFPLFNSFVAEGRGSSKMREVSVALAGSAEPQGVIGHVDWRLNYFETDIPVNTSSLRRTRLDGQFSAATKPFWNGNLTARFGAQVEGGNLNSNFLPAQLAPDTVAGGGYGALKFYGGVASRLSNNVFSSTYGLEIGSMGPARRVDWRKQLVDVVDDFWIPVRPHYALTVDTRLTAGTIQVPGKIPAADRFYGGNNESSFIPGDAWNIRDNPVIRALPANRLYTTSQGVGAENFASLNLTISVPVKAWPLVPTLVQKEAGPLLNGQITSATSVLQNHYAFTSPDFQKILQLLEPIQTALTALQTAVTAVQSGNPGLPANFFDDCSNFLIGANFNIMQARKKLAVKKPNESLYGSAVAPIVDVANAVNACSTELVPKLAGVDPASVAKIKDSAAEASKLRDQMQALNTSIQPAAAAKADRETRFVRRTINTLMNDLDLFSLGPAAVFDVAHFGPSGAGVNGLRYGPGGGLRLSVASFVNFTVGYARNVNRQPGESSGAVFFAIGVRDLFH